MLYNLTQDELESIMSLTRMQKLFKDNNLKEINQNLEDEEYYLSEKSSPEEVSVLKEIILSDAIHSN